MALRLAGSRYSQLLDILLEAEAVDGAAAFPPNVLEPLRRALCCDAASYREWTVDRVTQFSLAADQPDEWLSVWDDYQHVRAVDPLPGGPSQAFSIPSEWIGRPLAISDFLSARAFRQTGLYTEICKPLGVRSVLKLFLRIPGVRGACFVFDSTRSQFTQADREVLRRLLPHLVQLRENAQQRHTRADSAVESARAFPRLQLLTPREHEVLAQAARGETNRAIGAALSISADTARKHLEHIYEKLGVRNRTEATAVYTQSNISRQR